MRQTCKCFARRQNFSACLCTSPHRWQFYAAPTRNRNCSSTTHKKKRLSADRSEAEPEEEQRISRRDEDSEREALDVMDTLGISRKTKSCSGGGSATVTVPTTEASGAGDLHAPCQNSPAAIQVRFPTHPPAPLRWVRLAAAARIFKNAEGDFQSGVWKCASPHPILQIFKWSGPALITAPLSFWTKTFLCVAALPGIVGIPASPPPPREAAVCWG